MSFLHIEKSFHKKSLKKSGKKPVKQCLYYQVRKYVYHDADNLDTAFDAGGKVSIGLTATTIVSQWTWSATLLQSSTVASKVRIFSIFSLGKQTLLYGKKIVFSFSFETSEIR